MCTFSPPGCPTPGGSISGPGGPSSKRGPGGPIHHKGGFWPNLVGFDMGNRPKWPFSRKNPKNPQNRQFSGFSCPRTVPRGGRNFRPPGGKFPPPGGPGGEGPPRTPPRGGPGGGPWETPGFGRFSGRGVRSVHHHLLAQGAELDPLRSKVTLVYPLRSNAYRGLRACGSHVRYQPVLKHMWCRSPTDIILPRVGSLTTKRDSSNTMTTLRSVILRASAPDPYRCYRTTRYRSTDASQRLSREVRLARCHLPSPRHSAF